MGYRSNKVRNIIYLYLTTNEAGNVPIGEKLEKEPFLRSIWWDICLWRTRIASEWRIREWNMWKDFCSKNEEDMNRSLLSKLYSNCGGSGKKGEWLNETNFILNGSMPISAKWSVHFKLCKDALPRKRLLNLWYMDGVRSKWLIGKKFCLHDNVSIVSFKLTMQIMLSPITYSWTPSKQKAHIRHAHVHNAFSPGKISANYKKWRRKYRMKYQSRILSPFYNHVKKFYLALGKKEDIFGD